MPEGSVQRYCANCGAEVRPDTSFCVSCGTPLSRGPAENDTDQSVPPPPTPPRSLTDTLRKAFLRFTERLSTASSSSGGSTLSGLPNRTINWFRDLPSVPKLILVGLVLLFLLILLSPITFFVGLALILVGIVATVITLLQRKPLKSWFVVTGIAVAFTSIIGVVSNVTYNTNHLWGIGYELTAEEENYLSQVKREQGAC